MHIIIIITTICMIKNRFAYPQSLGRLKDLYNNFDVLKKKTNSCGNLSQI